MRNNLFFPLVALLLIAGCVSQATYDTKTREAVSLTAQAEDLQAQVVSLTAQINTLKAEKEALQTEKVAVQAKVDELSQKAEKAAQLEKATQTYQDLTKKLEREIQAGQVQITEMKNRLTMTMLDKIIFPSGSAEISADGKKVLDKV